MNKIDISIKLIKKSLIKISQYANYGTYDDEIILDKDTIKKYYIENYTFNT